MRHDTDILDALRSAKATLKARATERARANTDLARARVAHDKAHKAYLEASSAYDASRAAAVEAFPDSSKL